MVHGNNKLLKIQLNKFFVTKNIIILIVAPKNKKTICFRLPKYRVLFFITNEQNFDMSLIFFNKIKNKSYISYKNISRKKHKDSI
jgi:hypothetical protein